MYTISEISSIKKFRELKSDWDSFLEKSGMYSPFLTYDWFNCCLAGYSEKKDVFVIIIKNGSHIKGIVPLWCFHASIRGISLRKLEFINSPDSPLADFIIYDSERKEILDVIFKYLHDEKRKSWDVLTLNQWPLTSPNFSIVKQVLLDKQKKHFLQIASLTPYLSITKDWESYLRSKSVKFRKTHRNIINRVKKMENVSIICFRQDGDGTLYKDIVDVSNRSWKASVDKAISSKAESKIFFEMLTNICGKKGWLFVWLMKVDGIPVAMEYDLEYDGKVYALRADFKEECKAYSPGAYLEYHIIQYLFENGYREYNTGPGMNTYKLAWTKECRENVNMNICNNSLKGWTIWALENNIFPFLRQIRDLKEK